MTEQECLSKMIAPGQVRPSKPYLGGVIQVWVTRACDKACFGCTQGSNLGGRPGFIEPEQFKLALQSLRGYFGVVGMFGGNPAMHPDFEQLCRIMAQEVPLNQRGIWSNNPITLAKAQVMRATFNPGYSNLNVHLDQKAYDLFKQGWPECNPVGLAMDSRHSPPFVAMRDVVEDEGRRWELISNCDINQKWSAMIGVFRGELRAWFCEVAGAQAMLHQDEPGYPDTGLDPTNLEWTWTDQGHHGRLAPWWQLPMGAFANQVRKHCHSCGVPLRGFGELAQAVQQVTKNPAQMSAAALESGAVEEVLYDPAEQTSVAHANVYKPKRVGRPVQVVERLEQLGIGRIQEVTRYLSNSKV